MKKSLKVIIALSAIMLVLVGCNNKNENETITNNENSNNNNNSIVIESDPINTTYDNETVFDLIESVSKLDESTMLTDQQIDKEFEFNEYDALEKEIRSNITEDSITEVGIIKLGNISQAEKVIEIVLKRKTALDAKYAENLKIMQILGNSDNFILKHEGGVVKYIIAENAKEMGI